MPFFRGVAVKSGNNNQEVPMFEEHTGRSLLGGDEEAFCSDDWFTQFNRNYRLFKPLTTSSGTLHPLNLGRSLQSLEMLQCRHIFGAVFEEQPGSVPAHIWSSL